MAEDNYFNLASRFEEMFKDRPKILFDINSILRDYFSIEHRSYYIHSIENFNAMYCEAMDISVKELTRRNRERSIVSTRQLYCYLAKDIFGSRYSLKEIGLYLAKRDHTTVIHSINTVSDRLDAKDQLLLALFNKWDTFYVSSHTE